MVKNIVSVTIPSFKGSPVVLYRVPVYSEGYNMGGVEHINIKALDVLASEFGHDNEKYAEHIRNKGVVEHVDVASPEIGVLIVDILNIEEVEAFAEIQRSYKLF